MFRRIEVLHQLCKGVGRPSVKVVVVVAQPRQNVAWSLRPKYRAARDALRDGRHNHRVRRLSRARLIHCSRQCPKGQQHVLLCAVGLGLDELFVYC